MRTEESSKNAIVSLIFYIFTSIFAFISKTIFIRYLGIEYSGLNSLFTNVLGVLNIAELGLGTAVAYSLYKPIAQNDIKTINEILKLYKYLYRIIGTIVLFIGIILSLFLHLMITSTIDMKIIRASFLLFLISTVTSYFFTFLNVLPAADQKNYIVTKIQGIFRICKNIIQLISIVIFKNYFIWLFIEIIGNITGYVFTNLIIKKKYTYYKEIDNIKLNQLIIKYKEIIKKVKDLFFHKIGSLVVDQTDNIVISYFCTLTDVGIYGNYILIFNLLVRSVEQVFSGITASIGNLIIEKGEKNALNVWKEMHILIVFVSTIFGYLFYKLANDFISIWIGQEYLLTNITVFIIALNIVFRIIKQPIEGFKVAFGIFWDKQAPFIEALINLVVSVLLASKIGILGVVIGTLVSNILIIFIWKPYAVFKYGFNEKFIEYIKINIPLSIIAIISILLINFITRLINLNIVTGWTTLIITGIIYALISVLITFCCFILYKPFRKCFVKYLSVVIKIIKKKQNKYFEN